MYRTIANVLWVVRAMMMYAAAHEANEEDVLAIKADADVLTQWITDYETMAEEEVEN